MTTPLRIGFAGANAERGWALDAHLSAVRSVPGLTVGAVSARTEDGAKAAAEKFGAPLHFADSLEMARSSGVDIVAVTVKVPEHKAIVMAALDAGKHVYCEWPLGRGRGEAEEMAAAALRAGTHVAIGLQGANAPEVRHAAKLVADGGIGRPLSLNVVAPTAGWGAVTFPTYAYLQDRSTGATLATIVGGHALAMIEAIVGPYVDVRALASRQFDKVRIAGSKDFIERTCADHLVIVGRHASGCVSTLEVVGGMANGTLAFQLKGASDVLTIASEATGDYQTGGLSIRTGKGGAVALDTGGIATGHSRNVGFVWRDFAEDIGAGRRNVADFDRAARLSALLEAIDTASEQGRTVALAGQTGAQARTAA